MIENNVLELIPNIVEHLKAHRELDPTSRISELAAHALYVITVDYRPKNMDQLWPSLERIALAWQTSPALRSMSCPPLQHPPP